MNLSIYAIKVGRTSLDMLDVSKELEMDVSIIPKIIHHMKEVMK